MLMKLVKWLYTFIGKWEKQLGLKVVRDITQHLKGKHHHMCVCVCGADVCVCLCVCVSEREGIKKYVYNITRSELASLALSLYVCLSGMDDIIIMHLHCTVPRALTVLYCICSDLSIYVHTAC